MDCLKVFANKSNLNRHTETVHGTLFQPRVDEFDIHRQSGGLNGYDDVQSTSQTNFENVGDQVDVDSQDADCSTVDRDVSRSGGYYGDSEFSESSDDDDPRQSGGTKFENADNQVDVGSEDDDQSMIVNVGSGSESDDTTQHSDSRQSGDD